MAEELLRKYGGERFDVLSAGLEPSKEINPLVIEVLREEGIDISSKKTNSVFEFFKQGKRFNYVITVCDESNAQKCPLFPLMKYRIHWSFADPSSFEGTHEEKIEKTRAIKELVKSDVLQFIQLVEAGGLQENVPSHWKID